MKVYIALYNPMIHESGSVPLSLHKTNEGANKAIENHKAEIKAKWEEDYKDASPAHKERYPYDNYMAWAVQETELLD